jgi:glutathione reductase (NADPH)
MRFRVDELLHGIKEMKGNNPVIFDLIVLGTGTAGQIAATRCRDEGWSVAMVESRSPGGTCSQRGCDAKKPLVNAASFLEAYRRLAGRGLTGVGVRIDWRDLIRFKQSFTDPIAGKTREKLRKAGIPLFEGAGRFTGERRFEIGSRSFEARHFLIATGLTPRKLNIPGEEEVIHSDRFLELDELPERIIFIGGGFISFEFAHATARAGAGTTIIERNPVPLKRFDKDLVERLLSASEAAGITVKTDTCLQRVERVDGTLAAVCPEQNFRMEADLIVHGAGRVPSVDGLDLSRADVDWTEDGVQVNEHLQSVSNPAVYAAGDVAASPGPPLTPVSSLEGAAAADNLLKGNHKVPDYTGIPTMVFSVPPLAAVGLTEQQAEESGIDCTVRHEDTASFKINRQLGAEYGAFKVLIEKKTNRIVGAHLLGPESGELINFFALAMRLGLTADQLKRAVFTYPVQAANIRYML